MRYIYIFILIVINGCISQKSIDNENGLQIDIFKKDMTYEKYKKAVIDYANKSKYPSLINE